MLHYCSSCLYPETKPDLTFDSNGICNACTNYINRSKIDWDQRYKTLKSICSNIKKKNTEWDCIVPVSGGKDSTYQVVKVLELGLRPLCVTSTTCDPSGIGIRNIENIKRLGVSHIQVSPDPLVRRKLNLIGLREVGDISWPEHVGIFTIPIRIAVQMGISLLVWGENSQNEYGGPGQSIEESTLTRRWLEEFGGMLGLRVSDLNGISGISEKDLSLYTYPSDDAIKSADLKGIFLGHFIPWDGLSNYLVAQANGFETYHKTVEGSFVNYENLDNYQTGIHDYFKYLKYGFGRATDIASLHIRRGRITREEGFNSVKGLDGKFPWTYLGKSLEDILEPLKLSVPDFIDICDKFTNKKIFKLDSNRHLVKDIDGNLIKINDDNP